MRGDRPPAPCRVLQRSRAEDDPRAVGGQRPLQRGVVADAARQLHLDVQLPDHAREQLGVGATAERGVEVDQVDPLRATDLPRESGVARRAAGGLDTDLTLDEPDGLAVGHVDGGQQRERHGQHPANGRNRNTSSSLA